MNPGGTIKTVVELDLVAYSDIASTLEEHLDVHAVKAFQDQIQTFVDAGLRELGLRREDVVFGTAGDNALLFFDDAPTAHRFAAAVHAASADHNQQKRVEPAKRWFRIGAATGIVLVIQAERRIVGTTVVRAVRLEASARRGQMVVDLHTFIALPDNVQALYGPEEIVVGKRAERYAVRRCTFVPGVSEPELVLPPAPPPPPDTLNDLYERLEERFHTDYVPVGQIEALRKFAVKHMGPSIAPTETLLSWVRVNPRVFQSLTEVVQADDQITSTIVGYFSLRPISRAAVELLESGQIDGAALLPEHVLPYHVPPAAVYIGGVAAKDLQARAALILTIKGEVRHFREKGVTTFYTKPLTGDGLRLAMKNGFLPVSAGRPDDKGVYRLTFPS